MYVGKDEPEMFYWITHEEAQGIKKLLQDGTKFINISRLDKMINSRDIKEVGTPDFIKMMQDKGYEVQFDNSDRPVIQCEGYIMVYEGKDSGWKRYETKIKRDYKKFGELVSNVKRLN
jgi:hypothetical protein